MTSDRMAPQQLLSLVSFPTCYRYARIAQVNGQTSNKFMLLCEVYLRRPAIAFQSKYKHLTWPFIQRIGYQP